MTTPITSARPSSDSSQLMSEPGACDSSRTSCASAGEAANIAPPPAVIGLESVYVTGDAGARKLVEQYEQSRAAPDCGRLQSSAALSCGAAVAATLTGIAGAVTVVGAVGGAASAIVAGAVCGKDLAAVNDCEQR